MLWHLPFPLLTGAGGYRGGVAGVGVKGPANTLHRQCQSDGRLTPHWMKANSCYLPTTSLHCLLSCQGPGPEMFWRRERREAFWDKEAILTWCLSHVSVEGMMCCIVPSFCPVHNSVSINGRLMLCWSCLHKHLIYFQYLLLQTSAIDWHICFSWWILSSTMAMLILLFLTQSIALTCSRCLVNESQLNWTLRLPDNQPWWTWLQIEGKVRRHDKVFICSPTQCLFYNL